jgi:nucleolar GTP-binding protein
MSTTYNFKGIQKIPESNELIDIILSKTQRKTATVVRKGFKI